MILTADYHTHTPYSHGKNSVGENAAMAKEIGLKQIGISDHGFSHVAFGLRRKQMKNYIADCKAAAVQFGIDVLVGIESNILGETGNADLTEADYELFDIYLCGKHVFVRYDGLKNWLHYGGGNFINDKFRAKAPEKLIKRNTTAYINVIKNNPIDAITHLGYLCPADTLEVAKCAADLGTYIELNSKKTHLSDEELSNIAQKTQARFIINSDAHSADRVGDIKIVEEQLKRINFPYDRIDNIDGRLPTFRFQAFKNRL